MTHTRGIAAILAVAAMAAAVMVPADCDMPDVLPTPNKTYPGSWVICVEESAERTASVAAFLDDTAYLEQLESRELHWRIYDDDSPDATPYTGATQERPGLVIVSSDGKQLHTGPWPDTHEALDSAIKEATGL